MKVHLSFGLKINDLDISPNPLSLYIIEHKFPTQNQIFVCKANAALRATFRVFLKIVCMVVVPMALLIALFMAVFMVVLIEMLQYTKLAITFQLYTLRELKNQASK